MTRTNEYPSLNMSHTYCYPRPALTVDCVVFAVLNNALHVALIRRGQKPYRGCWALPGGFVRMDETADEAAGRELQEETGLKLSYLEQLYTFSAIGRDPRERVVSVAYYALVKATGMGGGTDAVAAEWHAVDQLPGLAFDHNEILGVALDRLRAKIRYQPIGFELLPTRFTLGQLQRLYEAILGRALDKRNFRRVFSKMGILHQLAEMEEGVAHRPSRLYRFDRGAYRRFLKAGFNFEV